jgi:hypothetical protein
MENNNHPVIDLFNNPTVIDVKRKLRAGRSINTAQLGPIFHQNDGSMSLVRQRKNDFRVDKKLTEKGRETRVARGCAPALARSR